jgi:uncharacterized membrane protein
MVQQITRPTLRQSLVRFTIRDLLWLTFWCSVVLAVVGAVHRVLPPSRQFSFLLGCSTAGALVIVGIVYAILERAHNEKLIGEIHAVVHVTAKRSPYRYQILWVLGTLFWLIPLVLTVMELGLAGTMSLWLVLWLALRTCRGATISFWERNTALEFGDSGILYQARHLILTRDIVNCHWGNALPDRLFIQVNLGPRWEIDVDPEQHGAVSRALSAWVPAYRPTAIPKL